MDEADQERREEQERRQADAADTAEEAIVHARRADKAGYLADRLAEQRRSEEE